MAHINATGRRKTSVARVYLEQGGGAITINKKDLGDYFPDPLLQFRVNQPLDVTENKSSFDIKINVHGGGFTGQAEAIRLGISRALVKLDEELKPALKEKGFLTRDPRMVERKKYGQKKARKNFQFSKR